MDDMEIDPDTIHKIRSLRGVPITIIVVMNMLGGRASEKDIETLTGYTGKTLRKGLNVLKASSLVTRTHRYAGWVLTNGVRELALSVDNFVDNSDNNPKRPVKIPAPPTTTAINTSKDLNNNAEAVEENISLLKSAGVGEPMRSRIAKLEHVTPELIKAHAAKVKREKKSVGMLIHRLRENDPMPETKRDPEAERRKYVDGKYSEFIDH